MEGEQLVHSLEVVLAAAVVNGELLAGADGQSMRGVEALHLVEYLLGGLAIMDEQEALDAVEEVVEIAIGKVEAFEARGFGGGDQDHAARAEGSVCGEDP